MKMKDDFQLSIYVLYKRLYKCFLRMCEAFPNSRMHSIRVIALSCKNMRNDEVFPAFTAYFAL